MFSMPIWMSIVCLFTHSVMASPSTDPVAPEPLVVVERSQGESPFPISPTLADGLRSGEWSTVLREMKRKDLDAFEGRSKSMWAFLMAWATIHSSSPEEAWPYLSHLDGLDDLADYVSLIRGEVHFARDEYPKALLHLGAIPQTSVLMARARVKQAEVLRKLDRTQEAYGVYEELLTRPDPQAGNPEALMVLAHRAGPGSKEASELYWRVWREYPLTRYSREAAHPL